MAQKSLFDERKPRTGSKPKSATKITTKESTSSSLPLYKSYQTLDWNNTPSIIRSEFFEGVSSDGKSIYTFGLYYWEVDSYSSFKFVIEEKGREEVNYDFHATNKELSELEQYLTSNIGNTIPFTFQTRTGEQLIFELNDLKFKYNN